MAETGDLELTELLEEVRRIDVQSRRLVTDLLAGGYTSAFRGSGLEFDTVREYAEGDSQRSVDWNVTARMGRPFVKTFVDERELRLLFLLDLSASMGGGFGLWSARQAAARLCGCLALSAVRKNDKVGLIAFSGEVDEYVAPKKGTGHALRIVRDCLALPGSGSRTNPAPALEFAARVVRRHAVLFLVSDFFCTEGWERALSLCARRHDVVAVRIQGPERTPPERGFFRLRDPESGQIRVVDFGDRRVREAYAARSAAHEARTEAMLRKAGVDRMDLPVAREPDREMVARPLLRLFRMREMRGAKR